MLVNLNNGWTIFVFSLFIHSGTERTIASVQRGFLFVRMAEKRKIRPWNCNFFVFCCVVRNSVYRVVFERATKTSEKFNITHFFELLFISTHKPSSSYRVKLDSHSIELLSWRFLVMFLLRLFFLSLSLISKSGNWAYQQNFWEDLHVKRI